MSNNDDGGLLADCINSLFYFQFCGKIKISRRFVKDKYFRLCRQHACNLKPLSFSYRKTNAAFAYDSLQALRQSFQCAVQSGRVGSLLHFVSACGRSLIANIVSESSPENYAVRGHDSDLLSNRIGIQFADVLPVN